MNRAPAFLLALQLAAGPLVAAVPRQDASPVDLLQEALEAFLDNRYGDSIDIFERILRIDKENAAAKKGLENARKQHRLQVEKLRESEGPALKDAKGFMHRKDWVEAYERLQVVLERVPDHPEALALERTIRKKITALHASAKPESSQWFEVQGVSAYLNKDWFKAADSWEHVYAFNPDRIDLVAKIDRAKSRLEDQRRRERIDLYQTVAWDNLKQGRYREAVRSWRDLLQLDPGNKEAKEGISQARAAAKEERQRERLEKIQDLSQQAMDAYVERNYKDSLDAWKQVLNLDPGNVLATDYMKRIRERGPGREAVAMGDSPLPTGSEAGYKKGLKFVEEEKYVEAIEYLERHVEKHPQDAEGRTALELTRVKQKEYAEKSYKQGLMAYSDGQPDQAIRHWRDALRIDPDYQRARQALIKALAEQKT